MRFAVEAWATDYGAPMEDAGVLATPQSPPDLAVEVPVEDWSPRGPGDVTEPRIVLFTDGVRRIDARVWIDDGDGGDRLGICASYAAGIVRCLPTDALPISAGRACRAQVVAAEVCRGLFTAASSAATIVTRHGLFPVRAASAVAPVRAPTAPGGPNGPGGPSAPGTAAADSPDGLSLALQQRMGELEVALAQDAGEADLIIIDGPLHGRQRVENAVGYVKTHHVAYLPPVVSGVVAALAPGQRTPLFLTTTSWSRYSWYLRLPGAAGHAWAGIVRCEVSSDLDPPAAALLADRVTATVPRFASRPHKDPRAPQNLYPIAGLERALRHRLGDPALLYRALRGAA
jgi:hypothetical protein